MSKCKKRSDCFFGVHYDFHAVEDSCIGKNFNIEALENMLDKVQPDLVQCDTKGHPGWSSYMTKVGKYPATLKKDILNEWRKATQKRGIKLYSHYSGVIDNLQVSLHPEWQALNEDGKPEFYHKLTPTSVFSAYSDDILIPQLKELAERGLDGAWVDGECWGTVVDYSQSAVDAYKKATGKTPPKANDKEFPKYQEFCRKGFCDYVTKYITAVKKEYPDFEITSNYCYTSQCPTKPEIPLDFISADLVSGANGIDNASFDARIMSTYGLPWDLMLWGFSMVNKNPKTVRQMCQEAGSILSIGGGIQIYEWESPTQAILEEYLVDDMVEVAKFCRAREQLCHKAKSIADIAVLHSYDGYCYEKPRLFSQYGNEYGTGLRGAVFLTLENGLPCDILMSHDIKEKINNYKCVIVSETGKIEREVVEQLKEFASNGGVVIIVGRDTVGLFSEVIDAVKTEDHSGGDRFRLMIGDRCITESAIPYSIYAYKNGETLSKIMATSLVDEDSKDVQFNQLKEFAVKVNIGRGSIVAIPADITTAYYTKRTVAFRDWFYHVIRQAYEPLICCDNKNVSLSLMEKEGQVRINVLNMTGDQHSENVESYDNIIPLYDLKIEYAINEEIKSVVQMPENKQLKFEQKGNKLSISIEKLDVHSVLLINK